MAKAIEYFEKALRNKSDSVKRNYPAMFKSFRERYGLSAEQLYNKQLTLERGVMNGTVDPRDQDDVVDMVVDYMHELVDEGKSPGYARNHGKAVQFFMEANKLQRFKIPKEAWPKGKGAGARLVTRDEIKQLIEACHGEMKDRNIALIMFLKDSGVRVSDATLISVKEYLEAKENARYFKGLIKKENGIDIDLEGFATWVKPHRTQKNKVNAYLHIGPEATEAIDRYLDGRTEGLLFMGYDKDGIRGVNLGLGVLKPGSISIQIARLSKHLENEGERISAHSLRKFQTNRLTSEGTLGEGTQLDPNLVKLLQGKTLDQTDESYEFRAQTGDLTIRYWRKYDDLRVLTRPYEKELKAAQKKIDEHEAQLEALQTELRKRSEFEREINWEREMEERLRKMVEEELRRAREKEEKP